MRILLICHERDDGEVAMHVLRLARSLSERNHRVVVAGPGNSWLVRQCLASAIVCHDVPMRSPADPRSYLRVFGIVRRFAIDVLHGHGGRSSLYAAVVARLTGKPAVTTIHSSTNLKHCALTHRIIAANKTLRSQLLANRLLAGRIEVVYEGVPEPPPVVLEQRVARRERLGLKPNDVAIAMVATLDPLAGHGILIDAVGKLRESHPRVHLYLVGGTEREHAPVLRQRVVDRGLLDNVHFLDSQRSLSALLVAMDIFALPSHREGAFLSVIEALAVGVPVVASIGGGVSEVVQHGETGLLFAHGDGLMLAAMLTMLVEDQAWRDALGANARRHYLKCFTLERMVTETEKIYRAVGA